MLIFEHIYLKGSEKMKRMTLKAARVNTGLTQKQAEKLRVSNKTLCRWENGTSMPKANKIDDLCTLYGVCYDDIIFLPVNSL